MLLHNHVCHAIEMMCVCALCSGPATRCLYPPSFPSFPFPTPPREYIERSITGFRAVNSRLGRFWTPLKSFPLIYPAAPTELQRWP